MEMPVLWISAMSLMEIVTSKMLSAMMEIFVPPTPVTSLLAVVSRHCPATTGISVRMTSVPKESATTQM